MGSAKKVMSQGWIPAGLTGESKGREQKGSEGKGGPRGGKTW